MDNLEFCNLLKEAKRLSGKSNVDIIVALRKSQGAIASMLSGTTDSALSTYLPFIDAIGFRLAINKANFAGNYVRHIDTVDDAKKWLQSRLAKEGSSYELGEKLGVSHQTAMRIAKGGTLRLSIFLKLAELFGYTVTLDAK